MRPRPSVTAQSLSEAQDIPEPPGSEDSVLKGALILGDPEQGFFHWQSLSMQEVFNVTPSI